MLLLQILTVELGVFEGLGAHAVLQLALVDDVAAAEHVFHLVQAHDQLQRVELKLHRVFLLSLLYQPSLVSESSKLVGLVRLHGHHLPVWFDLVAQRRTFRLFVLLGVWRDVERGLREALVLVESDTTESIELVRSRSHFEARRNIFALFKIFVVWQPHGQQQLVPDTFAAQREYFEAFFTLLLFKYPRVAPSSILWLSLV